MLKTYTPEQVAEILQLNKNTVYQLIERGEIPAKRFGKVYRISANSLSFVINGFDQDILDAVNEDLKNLPKVRSMIKSYRNSIKNA